MDITIIFTNSKNIDRNNYIWNY